MISFDEAARLVESVACPLGRETVAIAAAAGRVLAAPVAAMVDSPPAACSAMDGYAVRDADFAAVLAPGTCVRIFTGAPVPAGADRVVIQEVVARDGPNALFTEPVDDTRYIRALGSDFRAGDILLEAGRPLDARAMVAAAGADLAGLELWRQPAVLILGTGDELAPPGEARSRPGAIPDSISLGVAALVHDWGGRCLGRRLLPDDLPAMERAAAEAVEQADLVVVSGGASVGEKDFAKAMFAPLGLELIFSGVAMKPGKPVWLGRARGRLVIGLPGNPTSAMTTARLLLAPLVAGMGGRAGTLDWRLVPLAGPLPRCGGRETFHRARFGPQGAEPLANQDSGAQRALADADLLLRSPPHSPARAAGDEVEALDF
jgi:molybdopterin molybdotransferase